MLENEDDSEDTRKIQRLHEELKECFAVVDTCLASYYNGAVHMYRPLTGQLRILLCDKPPLLSRVFPILKLGILRPIEYLEPSEVELLDGVQAQLKVQHPQGQEFRLARMPFLITTYENGLQVADLILSKGQDMLPLDDWMDQPLTDYPAVLSLREIIRSIADKGGGAHVDDNVNQPLRHMQQMVPSGMGVHVLFAIALGRYVQKLGLHYLQFRDRIGYEGRLQDISIDPERPTVKASAKVSEELEKGQRKQIALTVLKRIR